MADIDRRTTADFKKATWSNHKKNDVVKTLIHFIGAGNTQQALHWAFELLYSGFPDTLWRCLWDAYVLYIPKPTVLLHMHARWEQFRPIREQYLTNMPRIRTNDVARRIIAEVVAILTAEKHERIPDAKQRKPGGEVAERALAPATNYATLRDRDPPELRIPSNEFAWAVRESNVGHALFWLDFAHRVIKKTPESPALLAAPRSHPETESAHFTDPVWIFWEIIRKLMPAARIPYLNALETAYRYQWEPGQRSSRMNYFVPAILAIVRPNNAAISVDRDFLHRVDRNIPDIMRELDKFAVVLEKR